MGAIRKVATLVILSLKKSAEIDPKTIFEKFPPNTLSAHAESNLGITQRISRLKSSFKTLSPPFWT